MRAATIAAVLLIGATAAGASSTYHRTEPHHGRANISSSRRNVYPSLVRPGAPKPPKPKPH